MISKTLKEMYALLPTPTGNLCDEFTLTFRVGNLEYTFVFLIDYHVIPTQIEVDGELIFDDVQLIKYWKYDRYEKKDLTCIGVISTTN